MSGIQNSQLLQNGAGASGAASAAPSVDAKSGTLSLAEIRQNPFWQAALASNSILLWVVTHLGTTELC